jgi:hypothetical protein
LQLLILSKACLHSSNGMHSKVVVSHVLGFSKKRSKQGCWGAHGGVDRKRL